MSRAETLPRRELGIDLARGLALVSMYVAHFAPTDGPLGLLGLSEYLTWPLFAFLIGFGGQLGHDAFERRRESDPQRATATHVVGLAVRVVVLIGVGLALEQTDAQILIVLPHLAILLLLAAVVARVPSRWLALGALAMAIVAPYLDTGSMTLRSLVWRNGGHHLLGSLTGFVYAGYAYRLTEMSVVLVAGMLAARWWSVRRPSWSTLVRVAAAAGVVAALVAAGKATHLWSMVPYDGRLQTIVFDLCLCVGLVALCLAVGRAPGAERWSLPLVAAGQMTLTLYVVQVLVAAQWVETRPTDDSWRLLAGMIVGSLLLAPLWRLLAPAHWRGPIEALERGLVRRVVGALPRPLGAAS